MTKKSHPGNMRMLMKAWSITGGWTSNVRSIDFWLAVSVWAVSAHYWICEAWWDQVISVMPNFLGFTLGGFAIFLGFGSDAFRELISDADEHKSPYISTSAAFLIFVAMQLAALLYALAVKALQFPTPDYLDHWSSWLEIGHIASSGLGYFLFLYSITLAFRAAMRIFRVSRWYHDFIMIESEAKSAQRAEREGQ